jgi:hypothetical protein
MGWLVVVRRTGERGRIRYVDEGRKRHAQKQSLVCVVVCACATRRQEGQWISRWFGGWYCLVSAYSEIFAVWGEVRLGRRSVGANTYTPVVVGDSEGRFVLVA